MAARPPWSRVAPVGSMYRLGLMSSTVTAFTGGSLGTMTSSLYSFQWADATKDAWITSVEFKYSINVTLTTNQDLPFGLFLIRKFSVAPTGGTQATFASSVTAALSGAFDTNYGTTTFAANGDIRIGSTALLTTGTGNIDKHPVYHWIGGPGTTQFLGAVQPGNVAFRTGDAPNTQSLHLRYQEGFSIQPLASLGDTGSLIFYVTTEWIEMANTYY